MTKPDLLVIYPLAEPALEALARATNMHRVFDASDPAAVIAKAAEAVRGVAASYLRPMDKPFIDRLPKLEIIAGFGVGYDYIDVGYAAKKGIVVTNTPDVLTEEVADLTLGLMLATVRELPQADRYLRQGRWHEGEYPLTASLRGRRIGILGLGRIGKAIARRCEAFGLKLAYHGRHRQPSVDYPYYETLIALARDVDMLVVVAPGGAQSKHLVNRAVLEALGRDGILINVARGSVVDEAALIAALKARKIHWAGLDVYVGEPKINPAFLELDNVALFPHVGSAAVHTRDGMGQLVVDNLAAYAEGKPPKTPVAETPFKGW
jgi:lactate dehydrogenase-like 2-hydroxyacid dehydrogenase